MNKRNLIILILFLLMAGCDDPVFGESHIDKETAVHCILGEARGEVAKHGKKVLVYHAEALRNRGTTRGVFGCKEDFSAELSYIRFKGIDRLAREAWQDVNRIHTNYTNGATHWENTKAFGDPYWKKSMIQVAQLGPTEFFKRKKGR